MLIGQTVPPGYFLIPILTLLLLAAPAVWVWTYNPLAYKVAGPWYFFVFFVWMTDIDPFTGWRIGSLVVLGSMLGAIWISERRVGRQPNGISNRGTTDADNLSR